jgi:hypothetical protein
MEKRLRKYSINYLKGNKKSRFSRLSVNTWLIIVNVIMFIVFSILAIFYSNILDYIAIQPNAIVHLQNLWTIITSMFMHVNIAHIFVNMVSLFFIGSFVERLIGRKRYFWFYIISGIFAGLFFVVTAYLFGNGAVGAAIFGSPIIYAVGASGAIFAIGGLLAVLTPRLKVLAFFIIPMPMWFAMIFLLGILWLLTITASIPIGNAAHLGGLIFGLAYGFYLRNKYKRKARIISRYFR